MKEISEALSDAIFTVCNKIISKAKFDKTYKCRVVSKVSDGKYLVIKDNIEHTASSIFEYSENDIVTVLLPQNSWVNATIVYPQFDAKIPAMVTEISNDVATISTSVSTLTNNVSLLSSHIDAAETSIKLPDTRNDNNTPEWYYANHPRKMIVEFKACNIIGLTYSASYIYTPLITIIPWGDKSGGYPKQIAWDSNGMYHRVGISLTEWGDWKQLDVVV